MKILNFVVAAALGSALPYVAHADESQSKIAEVQLAAATASATGLTEGEVRKVDKEAGKVTIKHGPLKNLDMPAMTMVFQVNDKAMLDKLKAGDKINFTADQLNGAYTVTSFEPTK